ncbi:MAG: YsnF/AvaK domain-containing protein [Ktedonobacteraceae bacterium]
MAVNESARVIGTFRDHSMAEQAVKELHQSGWEDSQIHIFGKHSSGNVLSSLRQTFGGQHEDTPTGLDQLDLSDEQRQFYQHELDAGYTVVTVEPGDRQLDAREVLHHNGAYNVLLPAEMGGRERVVPIRREEAQVRKEVVQTGEIRIHKRVITENRTFTIPVTREEVVIERLPLEGRDARQVAAEQRDVDNGYAVHHPIGMAGNVTEVTDSTNPTESEARRQEEARTRATTGYEDEMLKEGGTIRVFVREERVKIEKYPVIVEEIIVHKEVLQEERHIVEPLRHEEISVERVGDFVLHGDGFENAAP